MTLARRDVVLQRLGTARQALARALDVPTVKQVHDVAAAQEVYARRQQLSEEVIGQAHALKIEALARLGELLRSMVKATHGRVKSTGTLGEPVPVQPARLRELGLTKKLSAVAQQLAALPLRTRTAIAQRELKLGQALRVARRDDAVRRLTMMPRPAGVFDVLVVDPPWTYDRLPSDSGLRGDCRYVTASLPDLKQRCLPAAPDAVLWLWTTNAFMREAYELLDHWHFTPKTILTWDKVHLGLGEWLRNVTEHCLVATCGRPVVILTNQTTLIREARREHSRKPEAFYHLVEHLCPGRKYELFARCQRPGWTCEGLETDRFAASV